MKDRSESRRVFAAPRGGRSATIRSAAPPLLLLVFGLVTLSACTTGSSGPTSTGVSVSFQAAPPSSVPTGQQVILSANVAGDSANMGVDWNVSCVVASCGSFNPPHTDNGAQTIFTAPAAVPSVDTPTVNITAMASVNRSKSATAIVTITSNVSVVFTQGPPSTLPPGGQATMIVTVNNDPKNLGVAFSLACGNPGNINCGVLSGITVLPSGAFQVTYTAPSAVPAGNGVVTITATSNFDNTKSASVMVTISSTAVSVAITQLPPPFIAISGQAPVTATVTNDPANLGVTWTLSCQPAGTDCGSISPNPTPSDVAQVTYTAPSTVPLATPPLPLPVTITATSNADTSKMATTTVSVYDPSTITIAFNQAPPATLATSGQATLSAIVSNDPTNQGVTWSVTCSSGGSACGTVTPGPNPPVGSTTFSATYTAPSSVPAANNGVVTITATATATVSIPIPVAVSQNTTISSVPGLLNGRYALSLVGRQSNGASFLVVGSIVADGAGNISQGEEDVYGAPVTYQLSGTYAVGADGRGTMTLRTSPALGPTGVQVFSFTVATPQHVLITEFDSFATASGSLDLQDPTKFSQASITGSYSFTSSGVDLVTGNIVAFGGVLVADGSGNFISGSTEDLNDGGTVTSNVPIVSGSSYSAPDPFGRGTATIVTSGSAPGCTSAGICTFVYYIVDSGNLKFIETDANFQVNGSAFAQGSNPSLSSGNFAFTLAGQAPNLTGATSFVAGGIFDANAGAITNGVIDINNGGTITKAAGITGGSYSVAANGRGTLSITGSLIPGVSQFQIYVTASHGVLMLELDSGFTSAGVATAQSSTSFQANGYALGFQSNAGGEEDVVGQVASDGTANLIGNVDINGALVPPTPGVPLIGTFASASTPGRFTGSVSTGTTGTLKEVFYVASSATVLFIELDGAGQAAGILQGQQLIAIAFGPNLPPASLQTNATAQISATVSNDNTNAGVDWSVTCTPASGSNCGSFSPSTHTASGVAVTYTAPSSVPTGGNVTIIATATASESSPVVAQVSQNVTITAPGAVTIAFSSQNPPPPSLQVGSPPVTIGATVTNDPNTKGVTWTLSCGNPPPTTGCGTISNPQTTTNGTNSYTVTISYTPPTAIPSNNFPVTITATANADTTQSVSAVMTITLPPATISFTTLPPNNTVQAGSTSAIAVTVTDDPSAAGVTWSVTCTNPAGSGCGTITPGSPTTTGTSTMYPATYTAPNPVPMNNLTVTIAAMSALGPSASANLTVTPLPITINWNAGGQPPPSMQVGTMATVSAVVSNDPTNAGVDWTVTCVGSDCGHFSATHTSSDGATVYTAPATVPGGDGSVTITATATVTEGTSNVAQISQKVAITSAGLANLLAGQYAFFATGTSSSGFPYTVVGSFIADGAGNITAAEVDNGSPFNQLTGTYTIGNDGRGTMTLLNGSVVRFTLSFTIVTSKHALITEFDNIATASGSVDLQNTSAFTLQSITGSYAFAFNGIDQTLFTATGFGGLLIADGNGNFITGSTLDENDGGTVTKNVALVPGPGSSGSTYSAPDAFGRGTATIITSGASSACPATVPCTFVYYIVDSGNIKFIESDASFATSGPVFTQGPGPFSNKSISGTYAFTVATSTGSPLVAGGFFSAASGKLTNGTIDINNSGAVTTAVAFTGTYSVASNGRGSATFVLPAGTVGPSQFGIYVTASHGILLLELDSSFTTTGAALAQSATTFQNSAYAVTFMANTATSSESLDGQIISDGNSLFTSGTGDVSELTTNVALMPSVALSGTFGASSATGRFTGTLDLQTNPSQMLQEIFYIVDSNTVLFIEVDATGQATGILQVQTLH